MQKGISLLEFVISLSIVAALTTTLLSEYGSSLPNARRAQLFADEELGFARTYALLIKDFRTLNNSRLPLGPRISQVPIRFMDGSLIAVSSLKKNSAWWGFLAPQGNTLLRLENRNVQNNTLEADICGIILKDFPDDTFEAVGLFENGFREISATILTKFLNAAHQPCLKIALEDTKQLLSATPEIPLPFLEAIHPLTEKFLYYTDTTNQLRRIQIQKSVVVENQPVLTSVPIMTLAEGAELFRYTLTNARGLTLPLYRLLSSSKEFLITANYISTDGAL